MKTLKKSKIVSLMIAMLVIAVTLTAMCFTAYADEAEKPENSTAVEAAAEETEDEDGNSTGDKAMAAAVAVGIAALGGAIGMGIAIAKSVEGIARQPEASGKISTTMMLGMVFIETLIIYALVVAILIIFVL